MYAAKATGRGTCCLYSPDMERGVHEDMQIHMRLKNAIGLRTLTLLLPDAPVQYKIGVYLPRSAATSVA